MTDQELMEESLEIVRRLNVYGVLSGSPELMAAWQAAEPHRFWSGMSLNVDGNPPSPDTLRELVAQGRLDVLGEIGNQYAGVAPDDPRMELYWAVAEELDLLLAEQSPAPKQPEQLVAEQGHQREVDGRRLGPVSGPEPERRQRRALSWSKRPICV